MLPKLCIYWVRRDFRLRDNYALREAVELAIKYKSALLPIFIIDSNILSDNKINIGFPRRKLLARILSEYAHKIPNFRIYCGQPVDIFKELAIQFELEVFANEDIEPYAVYRDSKVSETLIHHKSYLKLFPDQLNVNKDLLSQSGTKYTVFTPFRERSLPEFLDLSKKTINLEQINFADLSLSSNFIDFESKSSILQSIDIDAETIYKKLDTSWSFNIQIENSTWFVDLDNIHKRPDLDEWLCNEELVLDHTKNFIKNSITGYKSNRDSLALDVSSKSTSRLSFALKWGLISPIRILKEIENVYGDLTPLLNKTSREAMTGIFTYISELVWREFYKYILFNFPTVLDLEFQRKYQGNIDWVESGIAKERFMSWINGRTGYPLVDAAMNQIAKTGWMHNRMRMVVASVLTKNFGVDWRWGQEYFRATLVDLDEASNNGGWQWSASVGVDPKPIRIFNPYLQAENYDPTGEYQRFWLPKNYSTCMPIVEHSIARKDALNRYGLLKQNDTETTKSDMII